ncbi:MAG TPA: hypothetical protein VFC82_10985 [Actinomycetaceae bacterium]|nr:hypothetical protein [Actinomycetaceae bacterium]
MPGPEVAALGEPARLAGFALTGVTVHAAETDDEVRAAWSAIVAGGTDRIGAVVLTARAAAALGAARSAPGSPLTAVMPA